MKTEWTRPVVRYRNDAIFLSAQRLLASRPSRKRVSHWVILFTGMALGLVAGFFLRDTWHRFPLAHAGSAAAKTDDPLDSFAPVKPGSGPTSEAGPVSFPEPVSNAPSDAKDQGLFAPKSLPRTWLPPAKAVVLPPQPKPAPAAASVDGAGSSVLDTRFTTLRGEMRSPIATPQAVEFVIGAGLGKVQGIVRYMQGNQRIAANVVEGEIHESSLTLRETKQLQLEGTTTPTAAEHDFIINLPDNAERPDEFIGTWYSGTASGTLFLTRRREPNGK